MMHGDLERAVSRRNVLRAAALGAVAFAVPGSLTAAASAAAPSRPQASGPVSLAPSRPSRPAAPLDPDAFAADVAAALDTFGIVGAAVAVTQGDQVVFNRGFGRRDRQGTAPVTPRTRFRIASNTKSVTATLLATFVDDRTLRWDTRVRDLWPEFRAPTQALTSELRVRDLMGMATGLAEPPTLEFFLSDGGTDARELLRSVPHLQVVARPGRAYNYINTLPIVAAYLPLIAKGAPLDQLEVAYAAEVQRRVFGPIGMADAAIAADPRPLGDDYATGHTIDLFGQVSREPFISVGGALPAAAAVASSTDLARYLLTHLRGGVAPGGTRVVSAASLAATHTPGIEVPPGDPNGLPPELLGDTRSLRYCLGWFEQVFTDGRQLQWHAGGIDGASSLIGYFPADRIGFAILANMEPSYGSLFTIAVQCNLLSRLFGLNQGIAELLATVPPAVAQGNAELAAQTRPVDQAAVAPYLGLYSQRFRLRSPAAGQLRLDHDIRSFPVLALPDGSYVLADGPGIIQGRKLTLTGDGRANPRRLTIEGFDPVTWLTGE